MTETELLIHRSNLIKLLDVQYNEMGYYRHRANKEVEQTWKDGFNEQAKNAENYAEALKCAIALLCEKIDEVQNENR